MTVLDAVQQAVVAAAGDSHGGQAFAEYRQGAARMPEYVARFADVVAQSQQAESPFTAADATTLGTTAVSAGLVAIGHPGGLAGLSPAQLAAAGQAGAHLSEAAVRAVTGKKPGEISPQEYDLVTDPSRELPRRAARAVRTVAGQSPMGDFPGYRGSYRRPGLGLVAPGDDPDWAPRCLGGRCPVRDRS